MNKENVLIIDDEAFTRDIIKEFLVNIFPFVPFFHIFLVRRRSFALEIYSRIVQMFPRAELLHPRAEKIHSRAQLLHSRAEKMFPRAETLHPRAEKRAANLRTCFPVPWKGLHAY